MTDLCSMPRFWRAIAATISGAIALMCAGFSTAEDVGISPAIISAADQLQNCVISCRDIIDNTGNLRSDRKAGSWTILNSSATPSQLLIDKKRGSIALVFVHGYNTSCDYAAKEGNWLWQNFRAASNEQPSKVGLVASPLQGASFFTFCWRGDFGRFKFAESEKAAEISGPSLATFLQELHTQLLSRNDAFKLVLITHSLGAKVTLEAFNQLSRNEASGWVTGTLLVEPAITADSVATQTYPGGYGIFPVPSTGRPFNTDGFVQTARIWLQPHSKEGKYFKAVSFSRRVVATMCSADIALTWGFPLSTLTFIADILNPEDTKLRRALGAMNIDEYQQHSVYRKGLQPDGRLTYPANLKAKDYSPSAGAVLYMIDHNQIFWDSKLVSAIYVATLADWLTD